METIANFNQVARLGSCIEFVDVFASMSIGQKPLHFLKWRKKKKKTVHSLGIWPCIFNELNWPRSYSCALHCTQFIVSFCRNVVIQSQQPCESVTFVISCWYVLFWHLCCVTWQHRPTSQAFWLCDAWGFQVAFSFLTGEKATWHDSSFHVRSVGGNCVFVLINQWVNSMCQQSVGRMKTVAEPPAINIL